MHEYNELVNEFRLQFAKLGSKLTAANQPMPRSNSIQESCRNKTPIRPADARIYVDKLCTFISA